MTSTRSSTRAAGSGESQDTVVDPIFLSLKAEAEMLGLSGKEVKEYIETERQRLREDDVRAREAEREERAREAEREERAREAEREERAREAEREERARETEREERAREAEREERARETEREERESVRKYELEIKRMDVEAITSRHEPSNANSNLKVKMPFLEDKDDIESYLTQFERVAILNKWPEADWGTRLVPLLKGDAREAYVQMPIEKSADFQAIKETLLKRHQLNAVAYRKKFRTAKPHENEENHAYWDRLHRMLKLWISLSGKTAADLEEMLVMERFTETQTAEKARFIREREPNSRDNAIRAADLFEETRLAERMFGHGKAANKGSKQGSANHGTRPYRNDTPESAQQDENKQVSTQAQKNWKPRPGPPQFRYKSDRGCFRCGGAHLIKDCNKAAGVSVLLGEEVVEEVMESYVHTSEDRNRAYQCTVRIEGVEAKAMRDTGATQTQVHKNLVPARCYTGRSKTVVYANNMRERLPIARVDMETPYFSGMVEVLVAEDAPIPVLIGNDKMRKQEDSPNENIVAEKKVQTTQATIVVEESSCHDMNEPSNVRELRTNLEEREPRVMIAPIVEAPSTSKEGSSTSMQRPSTSANVEARPLNIKQTCLAGIKPEDLKREQEADSTLKKALNQAKTGDKGVKRRDETQTLYYMKNGILRRKYIRKDRTLNQVVVPKRYRKQILDLAHDSPTSGHMGVKRTQERITASFYWPGIDKDVRRHCLSCDICQRTMGRGAARRAPLQEVPIVTIPFKQVGIDIIGPINPSSSRGNKYVLTMVDYATKYVEATPLETVTTITVAEALFEMWSRVGIPDKIVSDRGTQFTSDLMKEIHRLLSIKGVTTTPYHAQGNGLVERFNGTLKTMIRKLCVNEPQEWDRFIPAMLFAYRETPQESTGFSPFELLYGRRVKGPLQVLKKCWTMEEEDPEVRTAAEYITDLRNRLEHTTEIAANNQRAAKKRYSKFYNRKACQRDLEAGEKVLVLLPDKHKRLQLSWKGPFQIVKKLNAVDYLIDIKGKEKLYHVNLIKKYHEREEQTEMVSVIVHEEEESQLRNIGIPLITLKQTEDYKDVKYAEILSDTQKGDLQRMVQANKEVFSDLPGETRLVECEVNLIDENPVRVAQYPLPHSQIKTVKEEVAKMEAMGVIEKTNSPYNAPIVLVKKADQTTRFCTDYRALNLVTKFDAEPMPNIDEIFAKIGKAKYFSKLDLCKGFWQIPMKDEDKQKTAFSTPNGQYCWKRMPFGMKNASAIFSRMMRKLLEPLGREDTHNFIDDLLIANEEWEEHMTAIEAVLSRLGEVGLTAKPSKCHLGYHELSFLGHEISSGVMKPESDKVEKLLNAERPKTKKQVRAFLGLAGYYRKFVQNFAEVAAPLTDLTKKGKSENVQWNEECEIAFEKLKSELAKKPIMILPDEEQEYILRTDASDKCLGAVLMQERDGIPKPIAYSSKKLNKAEKNYSTIEKECLGVVWAVKKFEPYIYGTHFILETDHRPLEYLKRTKTDNGRLMRWALQLQQHAFTLRVIPGEENIGADYMSRI